MHSGWECSFCQTQPQTGERSTHQHKCSLLSLPHSLVLWPQLTPKAAHQLQELEVEVGKHNFLCLDGGLQTTPNHASFCCILNIEDEPHAAPTRRTNRCQGCGLPFKSSPGSKIKSSKVARRLLQQHQGFFAAFARQLDPAMLTLDAACPELPQMPFHCISSGVSHLLQSFLQGDFRCAFAFLLMSS